MPPTDSNIGQVSVVADPQQATFALVSGLTYGQRRPGAPDEPGRVGWHELLAEDRNKIFDFYGDLLGGRKLKTKPQRQTFYQLFSAGGQTIGGMLTKLPSVQQSCWLYYFNVDDIDEAARRVNAGGGRTLEGPIELSDSCWIAQCVDPQGALFALQGSGVESCRATLRVGSHLVRPVGGHCFTGQDGAGKARSARPERPQAPTVIEFTHP